MVTLPRHHSATFHSPAYCSLICSRPALTRGVRIGVNEFFDILALAASCFDDPQEITPGAHCLELDFSFQTS